MCDPSLRPSSRGFVVPPDVEKLPCPAGSVCVTKTQVLAVIGVLRGFCFCFFDRTAISLKECPRVFHRSAGFVRIVPKVRHPTAAHLVSLRAFISQTC